MQIYNDREKVGQKKIQTVQLEEKNKKRKFNVGAKTCAERAKERPRGKWDTGSGEQGPQDKTLVR